MKKKKSSGKRVDAPVEKFSLISNETLLALYRDLAKCQSKGGKRPPTRAWAFDAAAVAVASKLIAEDTVIADAPNPALRKLHRAPLSVASRTPFGLQLQSALGAALVHKTKKTGKISVVFAGNRDGDAWFDALEAVRAHRLPVIFVCGAEAKNTDAARRSANAAKLEPGAELAHITADGNDVVAMYRVAHEAVERARRDRGPTLIECISFQFGGHTNRDALANMENYLHGKGLLAAK